MLSPPQSPATGSHPRPVSISRASIGERRRSIIGNLPVNGNTISSEETNPRVTAGAYSKPQRVRRATSHLSLPVARGDHEAEPDQDTRSQRSFRSAKSSASRKSRNSVTNDTTAQALSASKSKDEGQMGRKSPSSSTSSKGIRGDKQRGSHGSQASVADASSSRASAPGSSTSKSGQTETPGRVNSTVTRKQQRMLIDAVDVGQQPKSTVASTRDPLDDEEDDVMMSDARDEPFEDDFEIDFQMLRVDEVVAPSRIPASSGAQSIYVPPNAQQLIQGMKRSLDNVEKARRRMEQKYLEEMHKRIALENELARLRRCITLGSIQLSS